MAKKIRKVLLCKRAAAVSEGLSLQTRLEAALSALSLVSAREEIVDQTELGKTLRLVAQHWTIQHGLAGVLVQYDQGKSAISLIEDPNAFTVPLEQFSPPVIEGSEGVTRQWVESILYFFIRENVVVLIQSAALRSSSLEKHFSWLLRKAEESSSAGVVLENVPPKDIDELIKSSHVKVVSIDGDLVSEQITNPDTAAVINVGGPFINALNGAVGSLGSALKLSDAVGGNLKSRVEITFSRSTSPKAQELLDAMAIVFRNVEDAEAEIQLLNGPTLRGADLKLSENRSILARDGVLVLDDAFLVMRSWLSQLVAAGAVTI